MKPAHRIYIFLSTLLLLAYGCVVLPYLFTAGYADHIEPSISAISWLFASGKEIYHPLFSSEHYSFFYGPLTFIFNSLPMRLLGPSTFSAKILGMCCLLAGILISLHTARAAFAFVLLLYCIFDFSVFWNRPDSFLILISWLALELHSAKENRFTPIFWGVLFGLASNFKIHGFVYLLPVWALNNSQKKMAYFLSLMSAALLTFIAPFGFSNISIFNYLNWLRVGAAHGIQSRLLIETLLWTFAMIFPVGVLLFPKRKELFARNRMFWLALTFALGLVIFISGKPGAGFHHLAPFTPLAAVLFAQGLAETSPLSKKHKTALVGAALALAALSASSLLSIRERVKISDDGYLHAEIARIEKDYPNRSLAVGYSGDERGTYYKSLVFPDLIYHGQPLFISASAFADMDLGGVDIGREALEYLLRCEIWGWILPKGNDRPFSLAIAYKKTPLFSEQFRNTFEFAYTKTAEYPNYDLWTCKN